MSDVVLKPASDGVEPEWRAGVLADLAEPDGVRFARPVRAGDGRWVVDGWEAVRYVVGHEDPTRLDDVLQAGEAFHRALTGIPRPAFLDSRDDPWARADRMAWGEAPLAGTAARMALLDALAAVRRPVGLPSQFVHGDLLGNILFAADLPPAVIDWAPYWRPPLWAYAVAVADAICWYGFPVAAAEKRAHLDEWDQMYVRALIFRIATPGTEPLEAYRPAVDVALALCST